MSRQPPYEPRDMYELSHKVDAINPRNFFLGHHIISDQISREGLRVVWEQLEQVLQAGVTGDVVEFGCYVGTTSVFIRRQLDRYRQSDVRQFHVYDSFAGLPAKKAADTSAAGVAFKAGALQVRKRDFLEQFRRAGLLPPRIHKGWFDELQPADIPAPLAFAFLDGDFYDSILDSLELVWPSLVPGGRLLIDDYQNEALPGVEKAVRQYFKGTPAGLRVEHNIAIVTV